MDAFTTIAGSDYVVTYDYKITSPGAPEQGPSYASGGQPAEPMEYEVTVTGLYADNCKPNASAKLLEIPAWLRDELIEHLTCDLDSDVYQAVVKAERERRDAGADYRAEQQHERIHGER